MMRVTHESSFDDVEELRKRFEEFRSQHQTADATPRRAMAGCRGDRGTARHESGLPLLAAGRE